MLTIELLLMLSNVALHVSLLFPRTLNYDKEYKRPLRLGPRCCEQGRQTPEITREQRIAQTKHVKEVISAKSSDALLHNNNISSSVAVVASSARFHLQHRAVWMANRALWGIQHREPSSLLLQLHSLEQINSLFNARNTARLRGCGGGCVGGPMNRKRTKQDPSSRRRFTRECLLSAEERSRHDFMTGIYRP